MEVLATLQYIFDRFRKQDLKLRGHHQPASLLQVYHGLDELHYFKLCELILSIEDFFHQLLDYFEAGVEELVQVNDAAQQPADGFNVGFLPCHILLDIGDGLLDEGKIETRVFGPLGVLEKLKKGFQLDLVLRRRASCVC